MLKFATLALMGLLALGALPAQAQMASRPPTEKVAGVVVALNGNELDLTGTDGAKVAVMLTDRTRVALSSPVTVDDIKPGSFIGVGSMADANGANTAVEITVFPESARGLGEGLHKWDQGPNSNMANGTVSQVTATGNRTVTVTYKGGQQTVAIPDTAALTTFENADKTALAAGAHVVVRGFKAADGSLTAAFITVGKDGFVPKA